MVFSPAGVLLQWHYSPGKTQREIETINYAKIHGIFVVFIVERSFLFVADR